MKIDKLLTIILYIVIGICILSAGKILYKRISAVKEYKKLDEMIQNDHIEKELYAADEKRTASEKPETLTDNRLKMINPDFIGILDVPDLGIRYPVVQGNDNEKYLNTTFEGKRNPAGCIFLDCENNPDMSDNNTFIYGHNMKDGSMFGSLKKLKTKEWTGKDVRAYFYTDSGSITYEFTGAEVMNVENIRELTNGEKNLILYTCWGQDQDRRLLAFFRACS
jgi:sortase B